MSSQTVFVLGAGFSCLAGIPLMRELRDEVLADSRIRNLPALAGQNERHSLEEMLLDLRSRADEPARQAHVALLNASLCLLWKKHQAMDDLPEAYSRFARMASESAGIVSLNWDLVCELALYTADIKWSYSTGRGTPIVKPHGSINWTNQAPRSPISVKGKGSQQVDYEPTISFRPAHPFHDPLFQSSETAACYVTYPGDLQDSPQVIDRLWAEAKALMEEATSIVFIGYSLPDYNKRARAEFQTACFGKEVTVIDPSDEVQSRFREFHADHLRQQQIRFEECSF